MRWGLAAIVGLVLLGLGPAWAASTIDPGPSHALVIGNDKYAHLPNLKTAVSDAKAVARVLRGRYGFKVTTLINAPRIQILDALDNLRSRLTARDNLLVYYAGHGHLDEGADRGYWQPTDAHEDRRANWLSNGDITDTLKAIRARHVLVVADSCYSGTLTRSTQRGIKIERDTSDYLEKMLRKKSRQVLASGGLEPVADSGGSGHSVFASALLDALNDNTGAMDGTQLFMAVREQVRINADQTPQYSVIRKAGHQVGGDFLFVPKAKKMSAGQTTKHQQQIASVLQPKLAVPHKPAKPAVEKDKMRFVIQKPTELMKLLWTGRWRIYASGPIDDDAANRFRKFLTDNHAENQLASVMFDSIGGSPFVAIELGEIIRKNRFTTSVGRRELPNNSKVKSDASLNLGELSKYDARCINACIFAFMGGEFRHYSNGNKFSLRKLFKSGMLKEIDESSRVLRARLTNYFDKMGIEKKPVFRIIEKGAHGEFDISEGDLKKSRIVNGGYAKEKWSVKAAPNGTAMYLLGERDTVYGIQKFIVWCAAQNDLRLYIVFDPQGRQEEVMQFGAQSLELDGAVIPYEKFATGRPKIVNGWLNADYKIPIEIAKKIGEADSVGFHFQYSREGAVFLGISELGFREGKALYKGIKHSCGM